MKKVCKVDMNTAQTSGKTSNVDNRNGKTSGEIGAGDMTDMLLPLLYLQVGSPTPAPSLWDKCAPTHGCLYCWLEA